MSLKKCSKVFLVSFVMMIIILIPDIIRNRGYFVYAGDYAFQQIPFTVHVSDMIKHGNWGWDWFTDMGTNLIGSYSFYLLGSIFFWMICFIPGRLIIFAMPVMLALKTALATLASYLYIHTYVKKDEAAYIGAIMYAFSGFQTFNIIFSHFHDVTALFPLLLLSFDMLVRENRRGFFAVMTALMAFTNYFFFAGIVVFVVLYYIVRCIKKDFRFSIRNFLNVAFEAITGFSMAAVLLVPTLLFVSSGGRVSDVLTGTGLISYSDNTIIPKIVQSIFILPDIPSEGKLFTSEYNPNNWASVSLYLPLFTVTGVAVYIKNHRKKWISVLLIVCGVAACVPLFNSAFYMFNTSYYARWYYMPILIMCLATAKVIDSSEDMVFGMKFQGAGLIILSLISLLPRKVDSVPENIGEVFNENYSAEKEIKFFCMSDMPIMFWQSIAFGIVFILIIYVYNKKKEDISILKKIMAVLCVLTVVTNIIYINDTAAHLDLKYYREAALEYSPVLEDEEDFFRISDIKIRNSNYNMLWGYPSAIGFHSIVPSGTESFYESVQGDKRMMGGVFEQEDYPAYGLLSVKYIFNRSTGDDLNVENYPADLTGFKLYDKQGYYYIYENEHFVPMGYIYDYCISNSKLEAILDKMELTGQKRYTYKKMIMMRALVLDDSDIERYKEYIKEIPESMTSDLDENTYFSDCDKARGKSCISFSYDSTGYTARINAEKPGLVYFSVPLTDGWHARVNGEDTELVSAHCGLTAVPLNEGENIIECSYETPGLKTGIKISLVSVLIFLIYIFFLKVYKKRPIIDY